MLRVARPVDRLVARVHLQWQNHTRVDQVQVHSVDYYDIYCVDPRHLMQPLQQYKLNGPSECTWRILARLAAEGLPM